jgi:hypothetical protein
VTESYLFIACMNNSGSTVLARCLEQCANVVSLPKEGHGLLGADVMPRPWEMGVERIWSEESAVFEDDTRYDWPRAKEAWARAWRANPRMMWLEDPILLEKSPPDLLRTTSLQSEFQPASFLLTVRNPYAVVEGIRRRMGYSLERCTRHWMYCSRKQIENIRKLERAVWFTYEDMCSGTGAAEDKIRTLLPELHDISFRRPIGAWDSLTGGAVDLIDDLNSRQIERLSPGDVTEISRLLSTDLELCSFFGYDLL